MTDDRKDVSSSKHRRAFNESARRAAPDDFWAQVQRTVNGQVVEESQIALIVDAISVGLELAADDVVLDLCCGNGALSDRIFRRCRGGLGVDFAEELIAIAQRYFEEPESRRYACADVVEFVRETRDTARFTKALCYGSIQLLPPDAAVDALTAVRQRFPNVTRLFLGNLPDRERLALFYRDRPYERGIELDFESPIGLWRTADEAIALAARSGWRANVTRMPSSFYAAHYRYDVVLEA